MADKINCLLCNSRAEYLSLFRGKQYYRCSHCLSVMMDPQQFLGPAEEKSRYDQHNNDVNDPGYRNFVRPLVDKIEERHGAIETGLDFGAGSGPVAAVMLRERGYKEIELYDPYYHSDRSVFNRHYHFIICSEVIEHFHRPAESFELLSSLLRPGGSLFCLTALYDQDIDFEKWYYKNDPTHVFFYHCRALHWIKQEYNFTDLEMEDRIIRFKKA